MKIVIKESQYKYLMEQTNPPKKLKPVSNLTPISGATSNTKPTAPLPTEKQLVKVPPPTKYQKIRATWMKSYNNSEGKKKGQDFDTWYKEFDERTKENARKNPEPKGERTFWAGDNGPKSPCKGGKCSGLN